MSLCPPTSDGDYDKNIREGHFTMYTVVARWWGKQAVHPAIWKLLNDTDEPVFLCFPSDDAVSIQDAINKISSNHEKIINYSGDKMKDTKRNLESNRRCRTNIIFIDATWKFAKEMDTKTMQNGGWPKHAIKIKLDPSDFGQDFKPRRFDIRTPPSAEHLSTAECIAHVLRITEGNSEELFDVLMKPLDLMVQQWHQFSKLRQKRKK